MDVVVMVVGMMVMAAMVEMEGTVISRAITVTVEMEEEEGGAAAAGSEPAGEADMVGMVPSKGTIVPAGMAVVEAMAALGPMAAAMAAMVVTGMLRASMQTAGKAETEVEAEIAGLGPAETVGMADMVQLLLPSLEEMPMAAMVVVVAEAALPTMEAASEVVEVTVMPMATTSTEAMVDLEEMANAKYSLFH